jgi:glycosyltransferase involved in cell wall biosynthesis
MASGDESLRLLALSWRYLDHPAAGGAEVVTHEILSRLAQTLDEVTCFTASYPGASTTSTIDGVNLIRRGRQATVHFWAWRWLRKKHGQYDWIIDQINTIPFFTPLYVPAEKRVFLCHQLAREYWWRETRGVAKLAAPMGFLAEPAIMRLYRRSQGVTGSQSTRRDLAALGIPADQVTIVPYPLSMRPLESLPDKHGPLRVVVLGRLTPAKFIEEAVRAFGNVQRVVPEASLDIVGAGDDRYRRRLERIVLGLGLSSVTFHGRVSEEQKRALLAQAHVHVFTSHREGWGLVVSEAAAMGTPSVGYDVPGVRDSIADRRLLVPSGDMFALASRAVALWSDPQLYAEVREAAWRRTHEMSPSASARGFAHALGIKPQAEIDPQVERRREGDGAAGRTPLS